MNRLDIHDYMLTIAQAAARRATCPRLQVGAVLARQGRVVATGYNGSLPGEEHCTDVGCLMHEGHCLRTVHAEVNALRDGAAGDTFYCTHQPCYLCTKEIVARGIRAIYYIDAYKPDLRRQLFLHALNHPPQLLQRTPPRLLLVDFDVLVNPRPEQP